MYVVTGEIRRNKQGKWIEKQLFEINKIIGYWIDKDTKKKLRQIGFRYIVAKKGTHVVPAKPT